jgi:hypothetical protein
MGAPAGPNVSDVIVSIALAIFSLIGLTQATGSCMLEMTDVETK